MKRTNFYLSEKELEFLKKKSKKEGLAASELLRRWIDKEMRKDEINERKDS